jgi:hypothetical protein
MKCCLKGGGYDLGILRWSPLVPPMRPQLHNESIVAGAPIDHLKWRNLVSYEVRGIVPIFGPRQSLDQVFNRFLNND